MKPLKVITLTQPWATLMVATSELQQMPAKGDETRSFTVHVPQRIAIHAGKGDAGMRQHIVSSAYHRFREPYASALNRLGYSSRDPWWKKWPSETEVDAKGRTLIMVPLAAIVGLVTFVECVSTNTRTLEEWEELDALNFELGNYTANRWAWRAEDQVQLAKPVPCSGSQGFWFAPDDVVAQVAAQVPL